MQSSKRIVGLVVFSAAALGAYGCAGTSSEDSATTDDALLADSVRITCESDAYRYNSCDVDTHGGRVVSARVVRQLSVSSCDQGSDWGYADAYVWVDNGCRAEFDVRVRHSGQRTERLDCSSDNYQYSYCGSHLDVVTDVRLVRQESSSPCNAGQSYGHDARGVWVDRGCRGMFDVTGYGH